MNVEKFTPPLEADLQDLKNNIGFILPKDYIEFLATSNGAEFEFQEGFLLLWPLTDLISLNKDYEVSKFASDYFLIGSDGGDTAYGISKKTSQMFSMPFIGMSNKEALFLSENFTGLIELLDSRDYPARSHITK